MLSAIRALLGRRCAADAMLVCAVARPLTARALHRNTARRASVSPPRSSLPYRVILLGFSPFERSALTSYFRLATNRSPAYEHADAGPGAPFPGADAGHAARAT